MLGLSPAIARCALPTHAWKRIKKTDCPHRDALDEAVASERAECEACGLTKDLRICLTCGYVGCCESHGAHDTEHFRQTGHPLIRPHRTEYDWLWCYRCRALLE